MKGYIKRGVRITTSSLIIIALLSATQTVDANVYKTEDYIKYKETEIKNEIIEDKNVEQPLICNLPQTYTMNLPFGISGSFKSYMDYRCITNRSSKQWELQQSAYTDNKGFRMIDDKYLVAMGSYYTNSCGEELIITLDTGKTINVITGDVKQDIHTNNTNQYVVHNGNIVEFIVDTSILSSLSRKMGDVSYSGLEGDIIKIEKIMK